MQRIRKRVPVIVVTITRKYGHKALTETISLLRKRHPDSEYAWLGACGCQEQRDQFHNRLTGQGALILDTAPTIITAQLINCHQQIKNFGSLWVR
jgi:hypothetical protein